MQTVWITKNIFTDGIYEAELTDAEMQIPTSVRVIDKLHPYHRIYYEGEWHKTEAEAKSKANEMRLKKIKSLEKQLEKLHKLEF